MRFRYPWLVTAVILLLVVNLQMSRPAADSGEVVWWPYWQQMTATSVIVQWTTPAGADPTVRYSPGLSFDQVTVGVSRQLPLGTQLHRVELIDLKPDTLYGWKI